ncbi:MAG: amidohydrolase family protein, partial [Gammaproteobacteria bacterium]
MKNRSQCGFLAGLIMALMTLGIGPAVADTLIIDNVILIDGTGAPPMPGTTVVVEDTRIAAVSPVSVSVPRGATVIDGTGQYLIPGLMDTHIHLDGGRKGMVTEGQRTLTMDMESGIKALHGYLYSGVTTVYDSGNHAQFIFRMRKDERAGKIVSPRIFATGPVVAFPGGYASGMGSTTVGSWDDIENLDKLLALNPDMVKFVFDPQGRITNPLRPTFPPELLKRLVQHCQSRGFRTTIHAPSEALARQAVDAGVNALAHVMIAGRINPSFAQFMAAKQIPIS